MNASTVTHSLHRHNLGHGKQSGTYTDPTNGNVTHWCPKESVCLFKVKEALTALGIASTIEEYYSPVGHWQAITLPTEELVNIAYYLAVDMHDEGEHFDIEEFRQTYIHH